MCEIVRAMIAGGLLPGVSLNELTENSFDDIDCPGEAGDASTPSGQSEICAVNGGSAGQGYAWLILLGANSIQTSGKPEWQPDAATAKALVEKATKK